MTRKVTNGVYQVGGADLSAPEDCLVYVVDLGDLVLIDAGAGPSWPRIADNIRSACLSLDDIHTLVLTHAHIDHIGGAAAALADTGCTIVAHELDADAIESADPKRCAARWYNLALEPVPVHRRIHGPSGILDFSGGSLNLLHTPGHTPGSMVAVLDTPGNLRVLFGQDLHGPFHPSFGSDKAAWRRSMRDLIALDADILCEGHYGVFHGKPRVRAFIEEQLCAHS